MYAIFKYNDDINFQSLPQHLLCAENMIINTIEYPPNIDNDTDIDIDGIDNNTNNNSNTDHIISANNTNLDDIPLRQSKAKTLNKFHKDLCRVASNLKLTVFGLEQQVEALYAEDPNILSDINQIYARILRHAPHSIDGLPILEGRPNKRRRTTAQLSNIPRKQLTKPQQKITEELRHKRKRHKIRQPSNPHVPLALFEQNERQRQQKLAEHTKEVIAAKEKELNSLPPYLLDDIDIDMHETISNNHHNHNRPKRSVNP